MKARRKIVAGYKPAALMAAVLMTAMALSGCAARTAAIEGPRAVASLEAVELGGVRQWVLMRGKDREAPVLLFVHGGPGSPEMPLNHVYGGGLEENFVLVHWDQRGAGKSYSPRVPRDSMTVDQMVADCHELTGWLKARFERDRIYLMGHSWGSLLGALTVSRYPEDYRAYIGIGQVVDMRRNEEISYRFVVEEAKKRGDQKGERALARIGPPPYAGLSELMRQRQYLSKYGGAMYHQQGLSEQIKIVLAAPEYTRRDDLKYLEGELFSMRGLWGEIVDYNLLVQVPRLEVPVYFLEGRHDYNTPWELVQEYYEKLDAPKGKTLIWFEDSAHSPNMEEPERFAAVMRDRVLAETGGK